jgi:hypothetical protein
MSQAQTEDPLIALVAKKLNLVSMMRSRRCTDNELDRFLNRQCRVDKTIIKTKPTTLAGALAALKAARHEFESFLDGEADDGRRIIISAIRGTIDVLEKEVGVS